MVKRFTNPRALLVGGGLATSIFLIVFGIGAIVLGAQGRQEVRDNLAREKIVGTKDSTIPGEVVDTGAEAQAFADVMRVHTLEASGGLTYSEMPRYLDANGKGTSDKNAAALNADGKPVENPVRQLWVTETALTTALNTAYFAEQVSLFVVLLGVALTLSGVGFAVLALGALRHTFAAAEESRVTQRTPLVTA